MILLNFGQKLHDIQFEQVFSLTSMRITEQIVLPVQISPEEDVHETLDKLFAKLKLTDDELKSDRVILLLPQQSFAAIKLIGDIYKRTGAFPLIIRLATPMFGLTSRPVVMDILDLEKLFK